MPSQQNLIRRTQVEGKGRLWVTSFFYKYKTSTTYPLFLTICDILYLLKVFEMMICFLSYFAARLRESINCFAKKPFDILNSLLNDIREYNPHYLQSAFTHNPGTTLFHVTDVTVPLLGKENTHSTGKDHCLSYLLRIMIGFKLKRKIVVNSMQ